MASTVWIMDRGCDYRDYNTRPRSSLNHNFQARSTKAIHLHKHDSPAPSFSVYSSDPAPLFPSTEGLQKIHRRRVYLLARIRKHGFCKRPSTWTFNLWVHASRR